MLNQPVPNPLAKNPNFYTHKVFASIGLVLIGAVAILFGAAIIFRVNLTDLLGNTATNENKVATSSAKPNPTANWKTYTSQTANFSIKYPSDWASVPRVAVDSSLDAVSFEPLHEKPHFSSQVHIRVDQNDFYSNYTDAKSFLNSMVAFDKKAGGGFVSTDIKEVNFNSIHGYRLSETNKDNEGVVSNTIWYAFDKNSHIYTITGQETKEIDQITASLAWIDSTKFWKTYFGVNYRMKYPTDWIMSLDQNSLINFTPKNSNSEDYLNFYIAKTGEYESDQNFKKVSSQLFGNLIAESYSLNGILIKKAVVQGEPDKFYSVLMTNKKHYLSAVFIYRPALTTKVDLLNEILSTFKFN